MLTEISNAKKCRCALDLTGCAWCCPQALISRVDIDVAQSKDLDDVLADRTKRKNRILKYQQKLSMFDARFCWVLERNIQPCPIEQGDSPLWSVRVKMWDHSGVIGLTMPISKYGSCSQKLKDHACSHCPRAWYLNHDCYVAVSKYILQENTCSMAERAL